MNLREELSRDLGNAIEIYGQTFEWGGTTYPCTRRPLPAGYESQDGGEVMKSPESIAVRRALFTGGEPETGDGIDDDTLQIKSVDPNPEFLILLVDSYDEK